MNPAVDISTSTKTVVPTRKLRCEEPTVQAGGGGINVARVVKRFGLDPVAIVATGGSNGIRLVAAVEAEAIVVKAVPVSGMTRESFTVTDRTTHDQFRFVLPGPVMHAEEAAAIFAALDELAPRPDYVVLSGSLPPGISPGSCLKVGAQVTAMGARLIADGPGEMLTACQHAYLVKPNEVELEAYVGRPLPDLAAQAMAARAMIAAGVAENVLVSLGEKGALLVATEGVFHYRAPAVELVSAVGAGDSMVGGIVAGLATGQSLVDAVAQGTAAGAAAILTPHTELSRIEDIERLRPAVTVERLDL